MTKPSLAIRVMDGVIPAKSKFFGFTWIIAIVGVVALFGQIQGESSQFYGIAESQLRSISFQYPVEIVEIPVVEGQQVDMNSRLLEVRRYDLDVERSLLDEQINEISAEHTAMRHTIKSEISSIGAERDAQLEALNTRIETLKSSLRLNLALLESISGDDAVNSPTASPLAVKIRGLNAEKLQISQMFRARIEQQQQKLADISGPGDARLAELLKQQGELLRQSKALVVSAPFTGSVGSVMFKRGEQVDAFNPVISIQGSSTQQIKGYIHEAVSNNIKIGQNVWIKSLSAIGEDRLFSGRVESLGSRIVEYPERLKRNPLVSAWGREAIISLTQHNDILQGEKVSVLLQRPEPILDSALALLSEYLSISPVYAWTGTDTRLALDRVQDIEVRIDDLQAQQIEASGLAWMPDDNSLLLVSDEQSALFELSSAGRIIRQFSLDSVGGISDPESISRDGSNYYLAASLSHSKKDKLKSKRRKLMRLRFDGQKFEDGESIDLYQVLLDLLQYEQLDPAVGDFIRQGIDGRSLDLEAHSVVDKNLYLGFKSPLDENANTIILQLRDIDALFNREAISASPWMSLDLRDPMTGADNRLSGFALNEAAIYLLTVASGEEHPTSHLWRYDFASQHLTQMAEYPDLRAEGIALEADGSSAIIVFDGNGKSASRIVRQAL